MTDPRVRAKQAFLARLDAALTTGGISRAELARRIGKPSATVSLWFTRARLPEGETMLALPDALGVSPGWLLLGEGAMHDAPVTGEAATRAFQAGVLRAVQEMEGRLADMRAALTNSSAALLDQTAPAPRGAGLTHEEATALSDELRAAEHEAAQEAARQARAVGQGEGPPPDHPRRHGRGSGASPPD